jgi:hypothetical protein
MKCLFVLVFIFTAAAVLVTPATAQDAKITSNHWESDSLIVSGSLSNPNGWPIEFVGFDKSQQIVTRSTDYTTQPDGAFQAKLGDVNREIKFVKVEFVTPETAAARTRVSEVQAAATPAIASVAPSPSGNAFGGFLFLAFLFMAYFLPTMIASCRHHRNGSAIFLVNLFFGWSVIGWLIALVWSATANITPPKAVTVTPS